MDRILIKNLTNYISQEVLICGFIHVRRDQGKMVFFDIRDLSGTVQGVVLNFNIPIEEVKEIKEEFNVLIKGRVNKRPERNINPNVQNGDIELEILSMEVLNTSEVLPFPIHEDTREVNEPLRLKYRYLDLRNSRLAKNIKNRFKVQNFIRNYLAKEDFTEIETPLLSAPTPEGSRSYVVPSRIYKNKFYSLPQSPQQYKQLLMVSGFEKYFQIARCMRDEDTRGDRQPEFTQLDMEMSYVTEKDVMKINEDLMIQMIKEIYPNKKIQQIPFPVITYKEAMEKYNSDKPDIREDKNDPNLLAFCWVVDFPMFEKADEENVDGASEWTFTHNPFSKPKDISLEDFKNKRNIGDILTTQYDLALNGYEVAGGSIRNHQPEMLKTTFEIMGYSEERIIKNFGHILEAFSFGAPPHGGIAWGFDRVMMILENEPNIREVIPFAKTGDGKDLLMDSPSEISDKQHKELGI
jgi:aspartyl-tRNA synthetase